MKKKVIFVALTLVFFSLAVYAQTPNNPNDFQIINSALGGVKITRYIGTRADVVIPATIEGMRVTELGSNSFAFDVTYRDINRTGIVKINSVVLPNTLIAIGSRAFFRQDIASISFPATLRSIGTEAFYYNRISSVVIPNGVTVVGDSAFQQCGTTTVVIPPSLVNYTQPTNILADHTQGFSSAFQGCPITRITLPANVHDSNLRNGMPDGLYNAYVGNNRQAATYTWTGRIWSTAADAVAYVPPAPADMPPLPVPPSPPQQQEQRYGSVTNTHEGGGTAPTRSSPEYGTVTSSWTTPSNATALSANQWRNGTIASGGTVWYSLSVNSGTAYRIWVDDADASSTSTTADVVIRGYYSDGTQIWSGVQDQNWGTPASFTANRSGTVYINVTPYGSSSAGSFGLVYSTGSTRPAR